MAELGQRMGSQEFSRWLVFLDLEELGPQAQHEQWAAVLAALHNGPLVKKTKQLWQAREFLPRDPWQAAAAAPRPATGADARAHLRALRAKQH